jgi:ubiquinol-cytochrome c reductase cytochrome c1 subunit
MRRLLAVCLAIVWPLAAGAQESEVPLQHPHYNFDRETIVRGGKLFAQYCLNCHSVKYIRYERLAQDLDLSQREITGDFMIPAGAEYQKGMSVTMPSDLATKWFGTAPPDLSLAVRHRGVDWVYSYLTNFYWDPGQASGWNNRIFPAVAMPNVLWDLSGIRDAGGELLRKGQLSAAEFDRTAADLTAWLQYTSDPSRIVRHRVGPYVLVFLGLFILLAYALKRAYWRDVH